MSWINLADNVAILRYPFPVFGIDFARNVTLLKLDNGRLVIHSTAPFSTDDVVAIKRFGEPAWLVDATLMHDSFAKQGRAAFPNIPYLAPPGFSEVSGVAAEPILPAPNEWSGQLDVIPIGGTKKLEHALFHRRSQTLILGDLIFAFSPEAGPWPRFFVRNIMRLPRLHGISVFFKMLISDRQAFEESMAEILELDFVRIVVAHRELIEGDAKYVLKQSLRDRGFLVG